VLQDKNPNSNGKSIVRNSASTCYDNSAGSSSQSNANGVISCIDNTAAANSSILTVETFSKPAADNDNTGDGNAKGCAILSNSVSSGSSSSSNSTNNTEKNAILAVMLVFAGLLLIALAVFLYYRFYASREGESKFRYEKTWRTAEPIEAPRKARPASNRFAMNNPGKKLSRDTFNAEVVSASTIPSSSKASRPLSILNTDAVQKDKARPNSPPPKAQKNFEISI
jgi:hypothetical protein